MRRAVCALAARVRDRFGAADGLVHLVGGFRGGASFTDNSDDDWRFLSAGLIDTLRHVTIAFHDDLARSSAGRAVIVSAQAAQKPAAGAANYAAAKAAAEAWMLALADSFRRMQSGKKDQHRRTDIGGHHSGDQGAGDRPDAGGGTGPEVPRVQ